MFADLSSHATQLKLACYEPQLALTLPECPRTCRGCAGDLALLFRLAR